MRYGLEFKILVIESLQTLHSEEAKEYTLSEIYNHLTQRAELNPSKEYIKTLKARIRLCLVEWESCDYCKIERQKHPKNNYIVLYYSIEKKHEERQGYQTRS